MIGVDKSADLEMKAVARSGRVHFPISQRGRGLRGKHGTIVKFTRS
jgi:hypothetical protein